MYRVRLWSVRHARLLERVYRPFEAWLVRMHPVFVRIGYERLERPVRVVERAVKGALFDCQMCGYCVLSSTGLACPMNCPKQMRNGPCGGVRADGNCEVNPDMVCVWAEAVRGSRNMHYGHTIALVQPAVDFRLAGSSSWLHVARGEQRSASDRTEVS